MTIQWYHNILTECFAKNRTETIGNVLAAAERCKHITGAGSRALQIRVKLWYRRTR